MKIPKNKKQRSVRMRRSDNVFLRILRIFRVEGTKILYLLNSIPERSLRIRKGPRRSIKSTTQSTKSKRNKNTKLEKLRPSKSVTWCQSALRNGKTSRKRMILRTELGRKQGLKNSKRHELSTLVQYSTTIVSTNQGFTTKA